MRILIDRRGRPDGRSPATTSRELYAVPRLPWLRVNMVRPSTARPPGDGMSGSINNAADKLVFDTLRSARRDRRRCGHGAHRGLPAGRRADRPREPRAEVPELLCDAPSGAVVMVTCAEAPALPETTELLGAENVVVLGRDAVDLGAVRQALVARGHRACSRRRAAAAHRSARGRCGRRALPHRGARPRRWLPSPDHRRARGLPAPRARRTPGRSRRILLGRWLT